MSPPNQKPVATIRTRLGRRLLVVCALGGVWCLSAVASKCYEDWDLYLLAYSDGANIRTDTGASDRDSVDTSDATVYVTWRQDGDLRLYEGQNEWSLGAINVAGSLLVITPISEE